MPLPFWKLDVVNVHSGWCMKTEEIAKNLILITCNYYFA